MSESNFNLNNAVLIDCSFTGCGGTRVIADGKIIIDNDAIDAQGVTSKKLQWFPLESLSFKDKHNKRIKRYFDSIGVPTPLGVVIDKDKLSEAEAFIENEKREFFEGVEELCSTYEVTLEQHALRANSKAGNERIGKIIKMVAMSKDVFRKTFKVNSMPPLVLSATSEEGQQEFTKILEDGALQRLVETAKKLFDASYLGKEKASEKVTKSTFRLKDMVYNLSFANPALAFVAEQFSEVLDGVNPKSMHDGVTFYAMRSFVGELSTEEGLLSLMEGKKEDPENGDSLQPTQPAITGINDTVSDSASNAVVVKPSTEDEDEVVQQTAAQVVPSTISDKAEDTASPTMASAPSEDISVNTKPAEAVKPKKLSGFGNF